MQISEDYFLINLAAIIIPAFILLISSIVISYLMLRRYSTAVKRLYQMNFNGVENERKRIANDIHDQIGFSLTQVRNTLHEATRLQTNQRALEELNNAQLLIGDLHFSLRSLVENIYPRELMAENWKASFAGLANAMSVGSIHVELEIEFDIELSQKQLHQMFRLSQEMLSNIINHGHANWIAFQIYHDQKSVNLNFTYRNSETNKITRNSFFQGGRGSFIIEERMRLLDAKLRKHSENGYKHENITFNIA
jgi:two-component system NarL family sensor kinase